MIEAITAKGKTIEDAVNTALAELGLTIDEVEVEVVEKPESGVFGLFGKKDAVVAVTPIDNPAKRAEDFLNSVFAAMNMDCQIDACLDEENNLRIQLSGENMGVLIGRRGQTLDSLQYLTGLVVNKNQKNFVRVLMDTENYREKRRIALEGLAEKTANKVVRYHKRLSLEPMNPSERRIIHSTLQNHPKVYTYSEGNEPYRYVVVDLK